MKKSSKISNRLKNYIIPTTSAEHLAKILVKTKTSTRVKLGAGVFEIIFPGRHKEEKRFFPDGEVYTKILEANKLRNQRTIVLHSGMPKPNEGWVELEMILEILKGNNIKPEVFFSYFPYGMQDKVFEKGETNVAENLIKKLINYYKVKKIYIIDAHFWGRNWVKKYPIVNVSATPILIEKAKEDFSENILFLSPDIGGKRRTGISGLKKKRVNSSQVLMTASQMNFKGRAVGIVDDLLETGGTLLKAYQLCKKNRAREIVALITHGVLPLGIARIKRKYSKLYLTNTIKRKESNTDITDLILKTISES
jgi:ribose-phosphate pyrophosphokinase